MEPDSCEPLFPLYHDGDAIRDARGDSHNCHVIHDVRDDSYHCQVIHDARDDSHRCHVIHDARAGEPHFLAIYDGENCDCGDGDDVGGETCPENRPQSQDFVATSRGLLPPQGFAPLLFLRQRFSVWGDVLLQ